MPVTGVKGPYIPRADGALRDWLENFAEVIAKDAAVLRVSAAEAKAVRGAAQRYAEAYALARAPGSRTSGAVRAKNEARRAAWDVVRPIAMRIKRDGRVPDPRKLALGVYPPLKGQSRIRAPRTRPVLEFVEAGRGFHRLRYHDAKTPGRAAKPYGVVYLQLYVVLGRTPAESHHWAQRVEQATRQVFDVRFKAADEGKRATYFGRWVTRRGLMGPMSKPVTATIA